MSKFYIKLVELFIRFTTFVFAAILVLGMTMSLSMLIPTTDEVEDGIKTLMEVKDV